MQRTVIILAGGFSSRLGRDKGLVQLGNKSLVEHVIDRTKELVNERIIVVGSTVQAEHYAKAFGQSAKILADNAPIHSPLVGAATGFEHATGEYSLLLACDTPFVSKQIIAFLFELSTNRNAAIPRWPNSYTEPLQAVYRTKPAIEALRTALRSGELDVQGMVRNLRNVRYVSTLVLQQIDPLLRSFFNVNTALDLRKAETILKSL